MSISSGRASTKHRTLVRGKRYPITMEGFKTAWRRYRDKSGVFLVVGQTCARSTAAIDARTGCVHLHRQFGGLPDVACRSGINPAVADHKEPSQKSGAILSF